MLHDLVGRHEFSRPGLLILFPYTDSVAVVHNHLWKGRHFFWSMRQDQVSNFLAENLNLWRFQI